MLPTNLQEFPCLPLPAPHYATVDELRRATLLSARDVVHEHCAQGAATWELAVTGRLAIHLSRRPLMLQLEAEGILVETQYPNQGITQDIKAVKLIDTVTDIRPDIIVHRRGREGPNCLVIEVKLIEEWERPRQIDAHDAGKLEHLTQADLGFEYVLGLWLALPRGPSVFGYYAEFRHGECQQDIAEIPCIHDPR